MADVYDEIEGVILAEPDYSTAPFTTRREPVQDIIHSLSNLYLEGEQENVEQECDYDDSLLLPPPPNEEDESLLTMIMASRMHKVECKVDGLENSSDVRFKDIQHQLKEQSNRMTAIECQLQHLVKKHQDHHTEVQQLENSLSTKLKDECSQVKDTLEAKVQELGRAIMDCLKWRDG